MSPDRSIAMLTDHLRMAWRSEAIILEAGVSRVARQAGLMALAGVLAIFGLAALDAAVFFDLAPIWGNALALVSVGLGDLLLAAILLAFASRKTKSQQIQMAEELRDQAFAAVDLDVKLALSQFLQLARNPFAFISGPIVSLLVALFTHVLKSQRKEHAG